MKTKSPYRFFQFVFYTVLSATLLSCAQQLAPQGGPVDENPPVLVTSMPENLSTFFKAKKFELVFNEYVRVKDERENLIFSPVLKHDYEILEKGKKIIITIHDTLKENTTYVANFNDAIIDITEENPLSGFQYIFSTGSYVDSLRIRGSIINAFTLEPEKNKVVMLYESMDDSIPYIEPPRYITKTNESGLFEITNIKAGSYKAFALSDKNKNYLYDPQQEALGFSDSIFKIQPDTSVPEVNFIMFTEDSERQYLKSYGSKTYGQFTLKFNLPPYNLKLSELNGQMENLRLIKEENGRPDSLVYWIDPAEGVDSLTLVINANDTLVDTVMVRLMEKKKKGKELLPETNFEGGNFDLGKAVEIKSPLPAVYDTSKIRVFEDSIRLQLNWVMKDSSLKTLKAEYGWKEKTSYTLELLEGAITDIHQKTNDSTTHSMTTRELKFYGTLKIKVSGLDGNGLLLLSRDGKTIDTCEIKPAKNTLDFEFLYPGKYGLKLIHDENDNGKWDTGKYLFHQQPERVTIYPGTITIRSNWDQEVEWILD